jgi:hypothetical protein
MYSKYVPKKLKKFEKKNLGFLDSTIVDVCSKSSLTITNGLNLISPMFPNEYPNNVNCTCSIESKRKSVVMIDVEVEMRFYFSKFLKICCRIFHLIYKIMINYYHSPEQFHLVHLY